MKTTRVLALIAVAAALWLTAAGNLGGAPATTPSADSKEQIAEVRAKAFQLLLEGEFSDGLALLETKTGRAIGPAGDSARALTAAYLESQRAIDSGSALI